MGRVVIVFALGALLILGLTLFLNRPQPNIPNHVGMTPVLSVKFSEGAPKDTFIIKSYCQSVVGTLVLDMTRSAGGLIFDVSPASAGTEVYQPFEIVNGEAFLKAMPRVRDGEQKMTLALLDMGMGDEIRFTIDMDSTAGGSVITVEGNEILGGKVIWNGESAEFTDQAVATLAC